MTLKILRCACLLAFSIGAGAQTTVSISPDAPSREDVKKLFDVMASRQQLSQMMQQLYAQMKSMNHEQIKKEHPEITDADLARMDRDSQDLVSNFPVDEMLNDMMPIYQRHFTKSDIDALTAFYSSSAGQKFLHEMPAVTVETMQVIYPRLQTLVDKSPNKPKTDSSQK